MQQNRVKKILREGGLALGTHLGGIPDPQIVELIGLAGFDFVAACFSDGPLTDPTADPPGR
jgi:2-keto-3-deoxy-L-rhamnonate aldolase RhmA